MRAKSNNIESSYRKEHLAMRQEIVEKHLKIMAENDLAAIISCSPENFAYVTGLVVPSQPLIRHRHAMAITTADGHAAIFCIDMEETTVKQNLPNVPITVWREFQDDPMQVLADQLKELGLENEKVGIEFDYLPASNMNQLQEYLPGISWEIGRAHV